MLIIYKEHKTRATTIITCPNGSNALKIIEAGLKKTTNYLIRGTFPAHSWKVAEATTFIGAMIESRRF